MGPAKSNRTSILRLPPSVASQIVRYDVCTTSVQMKKPSNLARVAPLLIVPTLGLLVSLINACAAEEVDESGSDSADIRGRRGSSSSGYGSSGYGSSGYGSSDDDDSWDYGSSGY